MKIEDQAPHPWKSSKKYINKSHLDKEKHCIHKLICIIHWNCLIIYLSFTPKNIE
jgi:hypothetical protein